MKDTIGEVKEKCHKSRTNFLVDLVGLSQLQRQLKADMLLSTDQLLISQNKNMLTVQVDLEIKDAMEAGISGLGTTIKALKDFILKMSILIQEHKMVAQLN